MKNDDVRADLASLAASLRAYIEWQEDTGATGFPRGPRRPVTTTAAEGEKQEGEKAGRMSGTSEPTPAEPTAHAHAPAPEPSRAPAPSHAPAPESTHAP